MNVEEKEEGFKEKDEYFELTSELLTTLKTNEKQNDGENAGGIKADARMKKVVEKISNIVSRIIDSSKYNNQNINKSGNEEKENPKEENDGVGEFEMKEIENKLKVKFDWMNSRDLIGEMLIIAMYTSLTKHGKEAEAANVMLGRMLTRKECKDYYNDIARAITKRQFERETKSGGVGIGILKEISKVANRDQIEVFREIVNILVEQDSDRKVEEIKLLGRIGLVLGGEVEGRGDEECMGKIMDYLLCGIRDKNTKIRWGSVKYVSRIAKNINVAETTAAIIDEVIDELEEDLIVDGKDYSLVNEHSWHGGILLLAELARLRLVQGSLIDKIVGVAKKALRYEVVRGNNYAVGANIRDASCYLAWTIARTSSLGGEELAGELLLRAVFDREVHVRRAASAAFQELVGRNRQVKDKGGLDLLLVIDYYSIGNARSIKDMVSKIIKIGVPSYKKLIEEYIFEVGIYHWDIKCRIDTLDSIEVLIDLLFNNSLDLLHAKYYTAIVQNINSPQLRIRHGCILTLKYFNIDVINLIPGLISKRYLDGFGAEDTLMAIYELSSTVGKFNAADSHEYDASTCAWWLNLYFSQSKVVTDLPNKIKIAAYFTEFIAALYNKNRNNKGENDEKHTDEDFTAKLSGLYNRIVETQNILFMQCFIKFAENTDLLKSAINFLLDITTNYKSPIEHQNQALIALNYVIDRFSLTPQLAAQLNISGIQKVLVKYGLFNYKVDHRGDVGSWVRLQSLSCIYSLLPFINASENLFNSDYEALLSTVLGQLLSTIPKIRQQSFILLSKLSELCPPSSFYSTTIFNNLTALDDFGAYSRILSIPPPRSYTFFFANFVYLASPSSPSSQSTKTLAFDALVDYYSSNPLIHYT
ncbi:Tubulin-specific chaperone D [Zancudomyces culisetae]|uniref:Tubulin-specific chaperone D n=1 Tax=Zancudomyces culisetae TaxID=1213189 RepID=A0A1R1PQR3_ZANCU|nr:Tubulin-specific chaperone D [Zancudomyces culisetae]|eukprot:OMH83289.1 Tubulin-specific chaperone D [Zancudomyces culisetae]